MVQARSLRPITRDNWRACVGLGVAPEQRRFVASNAHSLAQAAYEPECTPLAVYAGDRMVGFVMYVVDEGDGRFGQLGETRGWIYRLMVDARHQQRGHGDFALRETLRRLVDEHGCTAIFIDYVRGNDAVRDFYLRRGFAETGDVINAHDLVLRYDPAGEWREGGAR